LIGRHHARATGAHALEYRRKGSVALVGEFPEARRRFTTKERRKRRRTKSRLAEAGRAALRAVGGQEIRKLKLVWVRSQLEFPDLLPA
jgi:hypothetical protein